MGSLVLNIKEILIWFYLKGENYEFRKNRNPYRVWISETLLQQTRLNAAMGKINSFLETFPDLDTLANAHEQDVLFAFQGLGYYNRARNLHKGAQFMSGRYSQIPENYEQLLEVPSIGPYTAAAISSICFKKKHLSIDGNVRRIFARMLKIDQNVSDSAFDKNLRQLTDTVFMELTDHPGDINEALMQFGQKICKAQSPRCEECPVSDRCLALTMNCIAGYPVMKVQIRKIPVNWKIFFFLYEGQVLLSKYNNFYFLKKQTGFPSILELPDDKIFSTQSKILIKFFNERKETTFVKAKKHTITNHKISFYYNVVNFTDGKLDDDNLFWSPIENVRDKLISTGLIKVWDQLKNQQLARGGT